LKTFNPNLVLRVSELNISYLRPGVGSKPEAEGCVLKPGEKLIFCESKIWVVQDDRKEWIAKSSAVMATVISEEQS